MSTRAILLFLFLLLASVGAASAQTRKWTARTGDFTVEAELLDVAHDLATLKRTDGKVIKVPLEKLSLGDLRYIQQVLKEAAGESEDKPAPEKNPPEKPAESEPPKEEEDPFKSVAPRGEPAMPKSKPSSAAASPFSEPAPESASKPSAPDAEPKKPQPSALAGSNAPVVKRSSGRWQAVPDPPSKKSELADLTTLRLSIPGLSVTKCAMSGTPSRFFCAADSSDNQILVYDLKSGEKVASIPTPDGVVQQIAVSPDGEEVAVHISGKGAVQIYSTEDRSLKKMIDTGARFLHSQLLVYAGPRRLLFHDSQAKKIAIVDTGAGKPIGSFPSDHFPQFRKSPLSPGGAYMAVQSGFNKPIQLIDTRSGEVAGEFADYGKRNQIEMAAFSPDGTEFAALVSSTKAQLHCWSLKDGKLIVSHTLDDRLGEIVDGAASYDGPPIEWFEKDRSWLLCGSAIVDRNKGGPIWKRPVKDPGHKSIRWLLNDDAQLVLSSDFSTATFRVDKFDHSQVQKSAEMIAAGAKPVDVMLPPLSKSDASKAWNVAETSGSLWTSPLPAAEKSKGASPGRFASISTPVGFAKELVISNQGSALFVKGGVDANGVAPSSGFEFSLIDLAEGKTVKTHSFDYPVQFHDFSRDGKSAIFFTGADRDRIDYFNLPDWTHRAGFRPYPEQKIAISPRGVLRAGEKHLITLDITGENALVWDTTNFEAQLQFRVRGLRPIWPSPTGSHILVQDQARLSLYDVAKGEMVGSLETPPELAESFAFEAVSFRDDGAAIAAIAHVGKGEQDYLVTWDLTTGKPTKCLKTSNSDGVCWMNANQILIRDAKVRDQRGPRPNVNYFQTNLRLIDAASGRIAWRYTIPDGVASMQTWADRFWYAGRRGHAYPFAVVGVAIPSAEVAAVLEKKPEPKQLLASGQQVSLTLAVKVANDPIADKALEDKLRTKLTELLKRRGIEVIDNSPLRIMVDLAERETGRVAILPIGGAIGILTRSRIEIRETELACKISLRENFAQEVWSSDRTFEPTDKEIEAGVPEGKDPRTHYRELQHDTLMGWLSDAAIPAELYEDWYYNGLGESELGPTGETIKKKAIKP